MTTAKSYSVRTGYRLYTVTRRALEEANIYIEYARRVWDDDPTTCLFGVRTELDKDAVQDAIWGYVEGWCEVVGEPESECDQCIIPECPCDVCEGGDCAECDSLCPMN